jgi:signal peptidase I
MAEDRPASRIFGQLADDMASSGLGFRFQAKGRSMLPTIQDGEILHVWPVDPASIRVGEIVLFRDRDGFKAHRMIRKKQGQFVTRGDSSVDVDDEVRREQIVGKVMAKECAATGRTISLDGVRARLRFFAREARRQISCWLGRTKI